VTGTAQIAILIIVQEEINVKNANKKILSQQLEEKEKTGFAQVVRI
jgi:hypothetical protein